MNVFIAGIMQGSHVAEALHVQDYRDVLGRWLAEHFPEAHIYDPLADHQESLSYDAQLGREVFYHHNRMCREVDLLVAYLPEASMGTAIEMWESHQNGGTVVAISPLARNWAVRYCSHLVLPDLASFQQALTAGVIQKLLRERSA